MTQSMAKQSNLAYSVFLQDVIYESPDNGKTVRIRRRHGVKSDYTQFQLLDLLDLLHYSQYDPALKDMMDQMYMYFNLKYKGD